jgi:hypothetical protein
MRFPTVHAALTAGLLSAAGMSSAIAADYTFNDPKGDDKGPGTYTYPTDAVYTAGSFDITKVSLKDKGKNIELKIDVAAKIEDPWDSKAWGGNGFSVQFVQVYFDLDHAAGSGEVKALPGINVTFAPDQAWDRVVLISPQGKNRLQSEIDTKAASVKNKIAIPTVTRAQGNSLVAVVSKADLGGDLKPGFGIQVVMQSNEGFPAPEDLLTRKVNEFNGQHRFGGGSDYDCDPHAIDILVDPAKGDAAEKDAQFDLLKKYTCAEDQTKSVQVVVPMVYPKEAGK